ncbi:response regulator transcription factor [Lentimicrobium sp.]|jgi:two-component system alkaline phosphatase synthesis response regulator PhoP|nr:response regulator transcription factor [Lentimicrobium sp.]MCO5257240.1 response regulator transcription factor [Lentimicrobium sp.]HOP12630.1 response regulator transcription factor [Lentimicrobium sp.]HPR25663.1 response regulator transcription factor [Lentimicrobium sp.]HRW68508.1 response regulator transcription factor [Lentimicrobium sp.]
MENSQFKILLVDDEPDVLEFLSYNLKKEGYHVLKARNGREGLLLARSENPQLVILDVMMPEMDGIETCREIRLLPGFSDTIVVFLTARGEDYSQIAGFEAGADDYITKPIKPKVLTSRIKALLRRYRSKKSHDQPVNLADLIIDREKYVVIKDGKEISLPKKEFELLLLLTSRPNKVFSREEIFSSVWGNDVIVGDRTIDVHVRKIREKIGLENIKTIKGVGYKFEA